MTRHDLRTERRQIRTRSAVSGSALRPRIAVQRTNRHFRAQLINDESGTTLTCVSDSELGTTKTTGIKQAEAVGTLLGKKAAAAGIKQAVLDRRSYRYHGRVKAFADSLRQAGIQL